MDRLSGCQGLLYAAGWGVLGVFRKYLQLGLGEAQPGIIPYELFAKSMSPVNSKIQANNVNKQYPLIIARIHMEYISLRELTDFACRLARMGNVVIFSVGSGARPRSNTLVKLNAKKNMNTCYKTVQANFTNAILKYCLSTGQEHSRTIPIVFHHGRRSTPIASSEPVPVMET
jgi:hypothetical protein